MKNENQLIAEFMNLSQCEEGWITIPHENRDSVSEDEISLNLHYHTDWNELMKVVDKILDVDDDDLEEFYGVQNCIPNMDATYQSVVEFIKFYNDQNK